MRRLVRIAGHPAGYAVTYVVLMLPTYVLPWLGSNAALLRTSARAVGGRDATRPGLFAAHLAFLLGLCLLAAVRGAATDRRWLPVLPGLALVFDLTPGVSLTPLIPTVLHLVAIVLGAAGRGPDSTGRPPQAGDAAAGPS